MSKMTINRFKKLILLIIQLGLDQFLFPIPKISNFNQILHKHFELKCTNSFSSDVFVFILV